MSAGSLKACGFTPVLTSTGLDGRVALPVPTTQAAFQLRNALEDRLGQSSGPYALSYTIEIQEDGLAITADQQTTRFNVIGTVRYDLRADDGTLLASGAQRSFTGYSTTGNTVTTRSAREDAQARLMVILSDLILSDLRAKVLK
ncbi:MAG: LPS assembly lipoprotein LptE [Pseudomonadota bacterium]